MNEQILGLDIPVDHVFAMAVLDGFQQLVNVLTDEVQLDTVRVLFQDFKQVFLKVLEH